MVTDHELVMELCRRLNLQRCDEEHKATDRHCSDGETFYADQRHVTLGAGSGGYFGFFVRFVFGGDGTILYHEVLE